MKRKNMMTAFLCSVCLAAAPFSVLAETEEAVEKVEAVEETEAVEEVEAVEETEAVEEVEAVEEAEAVEEVEAVGEAEEVEVDVTVEDAAPERPDYVALDYVTLGEYKNLSVVAEKEEVTDTMVETRAESIIAQLHIEEEIAEGILKEGDVANIDFVGKKDGVAFDGGTGTGFDLTLGSGQFIEGFEEGLIGVEIGSTVDLDLTFPETYHVADLAGQDVVFTVTVNHVTVVPEVTDELIKEASGGVYENLEAVKAEARKVLEEQAQTEYENAVISAALEQICAASSTETYPVELKEYALADTRIYYEEYAANYGMTVADFVAGYFGITEEEFEQQIDAAVEESLLKELCIKGIAESEGIEITDEEYQEGCEHFAELYGYTDIDAFVEYVGGENVVKISLLIEEVYDYLLENVIVKIPVEEAVDEEAVDEEAVGEEVVDEEAADKEVSEEE